MEGNETQLDHKAWFSSLGEDGKTFSRLKHPLLFPSSSSTTAGKSGLCSSLSWETAKSHHNV